MHTRTIQSLMQVVEFSGQVRVKLAHGETRLLQPGEVLQPGTQLLVDDHARLLLSPPESTHHEQAAPAHAATGAELLTTGTNADVASLQQALLQGIDPTTLKATAAGGATGAGGGGGSGNNGFVTIDRTGDTTQASASFDTTHQAYTLSAVASDTLATTTEPSPAPTPDPTLNPDSASLSEAWLDKSSTTDPDLVNGSEAGLQSTTVSGSLHLDFSGLSGTVTFGDGGDVRCAQATWERGAWAVTLATPRGEITTRLHIAGRHNVTNALAATACTLAAGAPVAAIAQGLRDFTPVKGRSRAFSVTVAGRDITVVDDTYNANPDSMHAAIQVLAELPGPQLLVMGDMGEVGDQGPQFHAEAGALAREAGIPTMFVLGAQSVHAASAYGDGARHFNEMAALQDAVRNALPTVGSVLVKGSRFMKMEQVVEAISAAALPAEQQQKPINPREGHHGATH